MASSIEQLPLPMRRIIDKLRRNVYQGASHIGESGEDLFQSAIVNLMCPGVRTRLAALVWPLPVPLGNGAGRTSRCTRGRPGRSRISGRWPAIAERL
jgi:hypothetical protein